MIFLIISCTGFPLFFFVHWNIVEANEYPKSSETSHPGFPKNESLISRR